MATGRARWNVPRQSTAMAAGLATLRYIQGHDICAHVQRMSMLFRARLGEIAQQYECIGDVRGRGLMLGIEIVDPASRDCFGRPLGDRELARQVQAECFRRGLMIELGGRNGAVVRLLPPLIITSEQVEAVCNTIAKSFEAALPGCRQAARRQEQLEAVHV
ncbi:MAG TPA: aminotransferase class III-fold pyridoxal phosphate-dependent enzyme [Bryobacteraceae bacterium]